MTKNKNLSAEELRHLINETIEDIESLSDKLKEVASSGTILSNPSFSALVVSIEWLQDYLQKEKALFHSVFEGFSKTEDSIDFKALDKKLEKALLEGYQRVNEELGYSPLGILDMIKKLGATDTVKELIHRKELPEGYSKLCACGRGDLTVEYIVYSNEDFYPLFSDEELKIIRRRAKGFVAVKKDT